MIPFILNIQNSQIHRDRDRITFTGNLEQRRLIEHYNRYEVLAWDDDLNVLNVQKFECT